MAQGEAKENSDNTTLLEIRNKV